MNWFHRKWYGEQPSSSCKLIDQIYRKLWCNQSHKASINMYKLLGGLRDYFKLQEVQIDSTIFRLHNLFTTALLLACSLIITATQYVGQPISCIVNGIPTHVVNTFCWISSTFTMPDAFQRHVSSARRLFSFYCMRLLVVFFSFEQSFFPFDPFQWFVCNKSIATIRTLHACWKWGREVVKIIETAICAKRKSRTIFSVNTL